ncbi:oxygenase MpaB family protein [Nocardioides sp. CER19]|uniref:oxygenase MpaB family protein n=1 Tax=Nocardioides sp. CER19 TaxID=3038538 RepID=UPI00244ABAAA|nr:oxygenase MpaB family protein [Nocardioides sp. CER19]MDH2416232.1 oxygenase MpaB family protein [Nocardioides sp. CER19]
MALVEQVRTSLATAILQRVAGPDSDREHQRIHHRPGPRWFEPGSPITRVHGDASMFIGGIRALLLQSLHPAAMRGVSEHSGYRGDMWGRLARTSRFIAVTTFGHADDAEEAVALVRRIHEHVNGTMPDGTPYTATDPHLLAWVHAAEIDSFLVAHQAYGKRPLDAAGRDEYVAQTAEIARRLGVIEPPTTERELRQLLASYRPELRATPEAREATGYLLWRPPLPAAARVPYGVLVSAAIGLMPRWSRRPLGLPWLPVAERTVVRALGTCATGTIRWAMSRPVPSSTA